MQNYTDRIQISGCQGLAVERYLTAKRHARTCWNNENVFCLDFGNRYSIVCIWYNSENSNASFIWIKMTEKKKKHIPLHISSLFCEDQMIQSNLAEVDTCWY